MNKERKSHQSSLLDSLIGELMSGIDNESVLELCLSGGRKQIAAIPIRYRLIVLGFVKHYSLETLNERLLENNCEALYARSFWEATLIYAFRNGLSYIEWKNLLSECSSLKSSIKEESPILTSPSVSMTDINAYVRDNSIQDREIAHTLHKTQAMSEKISEFSEDRLAFQLFLLSNISSFSTVREKTRYYFCKYLLYYLDSRMEKVISALRNNLDIRSEWETLSVFRIRTALDRKKHSPDEAREKILTSGLSLGEIYRAFEHFYFEYLDRDWLQVLLGYYGNLKNLTGPQKKQLADEARRRNKDLIRMPDDDAIEWLHEEMERKERESDALYSLDNKKAVYQIGRSGENFLRKILRGELDLDRVTFIAFLLFFGKESETIIPSEHRINRDRLDTILQECGFPILDPERPGDLFFIDFMECDDPVQLLMEEAETMAFSEENFYLYKTYLSSASTEKKWNEITKSSSSIQLNTKP